jgi:hypothetical protein
MGADLRKRVEELRAALASLRVQEEADWHSLTEGGSASDFEGEKGEHLQAHFSDLARRGSELRVELERAEATVKSMEP